MEAEPAGREPPPDHGDEPPAAPHDPLAPAAEDAMDTEDDDGPLIADADALEAFAAAFAPPPARPPPLDAPLRGVLGETAKTGLQRYEWRLLRPLVHAALDAVLDDYGAAAGGGGGLADGAAGPPAPADAGGGADGAALRARLHAAVDAQRPGAPFTLQRLCELVLEPRRHYARLDRLADALDKVLGVCGRAAGPAAHPPPRPRAAAALRGVNANPPSPYMDGADGGGARPAGGGGGGGGFAPPAGEGQPFSSLFGPVDVLPALGGGEGPLVREPSDDAAAGRAAPRPPPPELDGEERQRAEAFVAAALGGAHAEDAAAAAAAVAGGAGSAGGGDAAMADAVEAPREGGGLQQPKEPPQG